MLDKLPELQDTNDLRATYATLLGYGPAGAGKTHSIIGLKQAGFKPLVLRTELGETGGLLTLVGAGVPFIPITSHNQLVMVLKALKKKPDKITYNDKEGNEREFGTVVLDSITQWGEMPLERYAQLKGWEDLHGLARKGEGKDPRLAYGFLAEKGRQLYKELFELPGHLYIIAREGLFTEGTGESAVNFSAPELPGQKLPRELPGWPDAVFRLRRISGQFRMITKGEGLSPARIRLPMTFKQLPGRCLPNVAALVRYVTGDESAYEELIIPTGKEQDSKKAELKVS